MELEKIYSKIEAKLSSISIERLIKIFNNMFPEELLGSVDSDEFKDEVIQSIIERVEESESWLKALYKKLFNEKVSISIDIEEEYLDEEM